MNMVIHAPEVINLQGTCRLQALVEYPEIHELGRVMLWFEVDEQYGRYLAFERSDAFVVALLPYLLARSTKKEPLVLTCEAPLSERLFYQLTRHYIPAMSDYVSWCDAFTIECETNADILGEPFAVTAGVSGGVDSYYTILDSLANDDAYHKVTHGLYGEIEDNGPSDCEVQQAYLQMANRIGETLNVDIVHARNNLCSAVYRFVHELNVTYVFLAQALALQKLIKTYYFSASHSYNVFEFAEYSSEYNAIFNMYCLSNENTCFYVTGADASRHEKTSFIADFDAPRMNLMVCRHPSTKQGKLVNCSKCSKCTRTIIDLDIHGKLDRFENVFDINAYRDNPSYYWGYLFYKGPKDAFIKETLEECRRRGVRVPLKYRIAGLKKLISHGFVRGNPMQNDYLP